MLIVLLFHRLKVDPKKECVPDCAQTALTKAKEMHLENIAAMLKIVCVMPVTSNEAERSFSRLKILKTMLRSTMTNDRYTVL